MFLVHRPFQDLISLLFPNLCAACNTHLARGEVEICSQCILNIPYTDYHIYADNRVARQFWGRIPFNAVMAMMYFKKGERVQNIIHNLKYRNRSAVGIQLGVMIAERLQKAPLYQDIDLIIAVPLHRKRERTRGYNQSQCIALGIAATLNLPMNSRCMVRKQATATQTKKNRYSRYENMKSVFRVINPMLLKDKHILLVDDVITTGATIEACALALENCGIRKLSIAAAAFAE